MNRWYRWALAALVLGIGAIVWSILARTEPPPATLFVAAAAAPLAVVFGVLGRMGGRLPTPALIGGAILGPLVAVVGHAAVFAFAAAFLLGFFEAGRSLLEELRVDPRITDIMASPWLLLVLVDASVVAPLTEETGKALGARLARPSSRREAFLAGAAAGAGFAIVENVLYALAGAVFGGPWTAIVVARAMGAAVHPLASGLVVAGWWDARHGGGARALGRGFLAGAGVHALWNGTTVALAVAETAIRVRGAPGMMGVASLAFTAALGVVAAAALWAVSGSVIAGRDPSSAVRVSEARTMAAWIVLAASLLVPVAVLILAFPSVYLG
ncbi:MAG TPA: PrsW family glutamic-type intramembrane protease [Actinomycetota bacterium]